MELKQHDLAGAAQICGCRRDRDPLIALLDEDISLALANLPIFIDEDLDPIFCERFLGRGSVLHRLKADQVIVSRCVEEMENVQDPRLVEAPLIPDGVTVLGSQVIKLIAERYRDHPDYNIDWSPE